MTTQQTEKPTVVLYELAPLQEQVPHETVEDSNVEARIEAPTRWLVERRPNPFREPEGCFLEMRGMWAQAYSELLKGKIALENISRNNS
ncbi:MAG: hypothetical protein HOC20_09780 [Chloroflexi bacterium]|nr:hypothetical protein [Chloroflexota bacterium]